MRLPVGLRSGAGGVVVVPHDGLQGLGEQRGLRGPLLRVLAAPAAARAVGDPARQGVQRHQVRGPDPGAGEQPHEPLAALGIGGHGH